MAEPLICPRDSTPLTAGHHHQHELARCGQCRGLWLPGAVVDRLVGSLGNPIAFADSDPALSCPQDGLVLSSLRHRGVEIDLCRGCRGVWLDAGELEAIRRDRDDEYETEHDDAGDLEFDGDIGTDFGVDWIGDVLEFLGDALSGL